MSSSSPLKVLIVGGGVAGPALAFWLSKLGHNVTILERNYSLRAQGQQIDIRGQGLKVIRLMGLEPDIRARLVHEEGIRFVDAKGKVKATFKANRSGKGKQSFTREFEIMRGDLVRLLFDKTTDLGVRYAFGASLESFEQDADAVTVRLSDGTVDKYDLLVGADGQSSKTRRLLLGPEASERTWHPVRVHMAFFAVPREDTDDNTACACVLPRKRVIMTRNDNPETTQVYLTLIAPDEDTDKLLLQSQRGRTLAEQKKLWNELFRDAGWQMPRFSKQLEAEEETEAGRSISDDFYAAQLGQVRMERHSRGRVTLLGDSGYCPSPVTGLGTTSAFVGAYVLAGEISKHCSGEKPGDGVVAALEGYDRTLRPFIDEAQKIAVKPHWLGCKSAWGVAVLNNFLRLVTMLRIDKLMQRLSSDDVKGWEIPQYPKLPVKEDKIE